MSRRAVLERLASGAIDVAEAEAALAIAPLVEVRDAVIDLHRALRQGVPEVIFGKDKTPEQVVTIARALLDQRQNVLVTRADSATQAALVAAFPETRVHPVGRTARIEPIPAPKRSLRVAVVTAGTTDLPAAEEALETLSALGIAAERIVDVGVAGLHRILGRLEDLRRQDAVIVVAGMEGALPSVVAGLVAVPVVAVPTSTGYGAALDGFTAMMANLTSCGSGVTVVNINNGFGAAMAVFRIARLDRSEETAS
jgi:pyridinium-3,5-biscarboxylic acid mononucleotide synthase